MEKEKKACPRCGQPMQSKIISHDAVEGNKVAECCPACDQPPNNPPDTHTYQGI